MKGIHQFVAGFTHGDAISNEALALRNIFRSWGFASEIYSEPKRILPELRREAGDAAAYRRNAHLDDIVLLHLSIGSMVNDLFAELPCRKALLYHNMTPPEFLRGIQEQMARNLDRGREQARRLAGVPDVVMADSAFNAAELTAMGYSSVQVLPLILDLGKLREKPNRRILRQYNDTLSTVLFVGRCVPNKRIEDILCAVHYFQRYVNPACRFIHVGSYDGIEQYHALLLTFARELQIENVELRGALRQDELNACYRCADLFLCMSEHEGFCIPLIESMVHDVPILAYRAAAIPETLDGAGVLFSEKRFDLVAEMMGRLTRDTALRKAVAQGQRARLNRYEHRDLPGELRAHLAPLLDS